MNQADAIVVLSGSKFHPHHHRSLTESRVLQAVKAYQEGQAPRLIMCGSRAFRKAASLASDAEEMKQLAEQKNIPKESILLEEKSVDTLGNAFYVKRLWLVPNAWKSIVLVTSEFHIQRSQFLFEKILGPDYKVKPLSAKSQLAPETVRRHQEIERKLLKLATDMFGSIPDGDDQAAEHYINHPEIADARCVKMGV